MKRRNSQGFLVVAAIAALAGPAQAARYDMNLGGFWEACQDPADPTAVAACANEHFRGLMRELGLVTAPAFLAPAETLGLNGFEFAIEGSVVPIHNDRPYWTAATESSPGSVLFLPRIHVRKGLPFSFEVGTQISYIPESEMFTAGAEVRWAINEGFYFIPDLSVRIALNHTIGPKDFSLSTGGWDVSISKAFGVAGMLSLTPYAGYHMLFVHASSHVVLPLLDESNDGTSNPLLVSKVFNSVKWQDNMFHRGFVGLRMKSYIFQVVVEATFASESMYGFNFKLGFDY